MWIHDGNTSASATAIYKKRECIRGYVIWDGVSNCNSRHPQDFSSGCLLVPEKLDASRDCTHAWHGVLTHKKHRDQGRMRGGLDALPFSP